MEDVKALAKKKSGKILVFSDTHGMDTDIIEAALDNFGQDVDVLLFCGESYAKLYHVFVIIIERK